jgi:hypothetical protein
MMFCDPGRVVVDPIGFRHHWQSRKFREATQLQSIGAVMLAVKRIVSKDCVEQLVQSIELETFERCPIPRLKFTAQRCVGIGIHG